jgi:hypothetical protein
MNRSAGGPEIDNELRLRAWHQNERGEKEEPGADEQGVRSLAEARELAGESGQDARTAGVFLLVVLVGVVGQLAEGGAPLHGTAIFRLPLLAAVAGSFAMSLTLLIRSRVALVRGLDEVRRGVGAPLEPFVPWLPYASQRPLSAVTFERELRLLVSTAGRCYMLAGQAEAWAATTGLLFVFWTLARVGMRI